MSNARRGAVILLVILAWTAAALTSPGPAQAATPPAVLEIDAEKLDTEVPIEAWTGKRPSLADVDGDGDLEIIAQNGNDRVYVIDARTGRALAELVPTVKRGPDIGPFNGPKAADLDGDGRVEVVSVNREAIVSVWSLSPDPDDPARLDVEWRWDRYLDDHHSWRPTADAGPVLADLTGDGFLEIVAHTEERGVFALRHDGSVLWSRAEWGGNADPVVTDVDGDGDLDAVFFTDAGVVYAVDGPTGEEVWRFNAQHHGVWPGSAASPGIVRDLDGDGRVEAVFCARNVEGGSTDHAPRPYSMHHFALVATTEGEKRFIVKPEWGHPMCSAYLFAHDADGDGRPEIFGMDWNTIGHKPGDWERLGNPHVFSFDADGRERWRATVSVWNAKPHIAMADWDADGAQDVIAYEDGRLVVLDAETGAVTDRVGLGRVQVKQGPLLADLHGDGRLRAVVAVTGDDEAFLVIDSGAEWREAAWPGWEPPVPDPPGAPVAKREPVPAVRDPPATADESTDASAPPPEGKGSDVNSDPAAASIPREAGARSVPATVLVAIVIARWARRRAGR